VYCVVQHFSLIIFPPPASAQAFEQDAPAAVERDFIMGMEIEVKQNKVPFFFWEEVAPNRLMVSGCDTVLA
jgi:hypothetical protein